MQDSEASRDEGRWRSIIQSAVDGIILIDGRGRIETFNPAAERLFGYTEAEVLGRNVGLLMPQPYRDEHDGYLARYLATGVPHIIGIGREVSAVRKDGSTFQVHLSVGAATVGGEPKFTGIVHDLSARVDLEERLRASEARWRSIIESAVDGIVVIDAQGLIESFNPAAERLFGYSERDVVGQSVNLLMPSPFREEHDGYLARYLATGVRRIIGIGREVAGRRRDGTTFPVHLSVGEMAVNGERRFIGILHDLSARVEIETQLRERTALARLGEMAAVIAHEVKNPLAGIRGAIQVIGGRLPKDSKDAAVAHEIVNRIDALNELMKDLLLFARPPQPHPALVDVAALIRTTADLLNGDPALKAMTFAIDGAVPPLMADAELLKIVFQNLLMNGAQAMQGRGAMQVAVDAEEGMCRVTVRDSGPGMPADVHERIFTPFFTTKARGTGLGLPTAKRIVEAHGGSIAVRSQPGEGTTVEVVLPLVR
jgi:two-component system sensor kinase FixL